MNRKIKNHIARFKKTIAYIFLFICFNSYLFGEPTFFYHGSATDGIECLEPKLRYTPGNELASPPSVYASDLPAFAAAHSFPWSSSEGIQLYVEGTTVIMEISTKIYERLQRKVYIYTVDSSLFSRVESELTGHTFRATIPVECLEKQSFQSVVEAIEYYGGQVVIHDDP